MSSRVRTPEVHYVMDDGWLVRHTHDIDLATKLLQRHLLREERWSAADVRANITADNAATRWYRVTPCLPGSYGEGEGWAYQYTVAKPGGRGAFRAVEWWLG